MLPAITLPKRPADGHKGTFGTVLVIGGSTFVPPDAPARAVRMFGGASLAALAALRSGCGLARLMTPAPVLDAAITVAPVCTGVPMPVDSDGAIIAHLAAEALDFQLTQCDAIVVGPALGPGVGVEQLVLRVLGQERVPVVADADALNAMARTIGLPREVRAAAVLTPHPGEFARLAASLGITHDATRESEREDAARALAQKLGVVVVLKGARTVVADAHDAWTLDQPNSALATGGSGDVLSGVIAGLIAQSQASITSAKGPSSLFECARAGVTAHAGSAKRWCEVAHATGGLLATDLLGYIPAVVEAMRA
jgi:ADP-dependent NAD(P)H-hydrate dehydratase